MRTVSNTATLTMWCTYRTLSRSPSALLAIELACATGHLATTPCIMGAEASISLLANSSLMHNWNIGLNTENIFGERNHTDLSTGLVEEFCFHFYFHLAALTARRTITSPFLAPGTDPRIKSRCCSGNTSTTCKFCTVTRLLPIRPAIRVFFQTRPGVVPAPIEPGARARSL